MAGVLGIDRALLNPVSMDNEFWLCGPHWKFPSAVPIPPITLEALVGGVGKVWARSRPGRAALG